MPTTYGFFVHIQMKGMIEIVRFSKIRNTSTESIHSGNGSTVLYRK